MTPMRMQDFRARTTSGDESMNQTIAVREFVHCDDKDPIIHDIANLVFDEETDEWYIDILGYRR